MTKSLDSRLYSMSFSQKYQYPDGGTTNPITFEPRCVGGHIRFATYDTQSHLNIYVTKRFGPTECPRVESNDVCLVPEEAVGLRNMLLRVYPLDEYPFKDTVSMTMEVPFSKIEDVQDVMLKSFNIEVKK